MVGLKRKKFSILEDKKIKEQIIKKLAKFNFEKDWRPTIFVCIILTPLIISLVGIPIAMYFI